MSSEDSSSKLRGQASKGHTAAGFYRFRPRGDQVAHGDDTEGGSEGGGMSAGKKNAGNAADERFASMHNAPTFKRLRTQKHRLKLDKVRRLPELAPCS